MISHWVLAARLKTLPVCFCPVIFSIVLAKDAINFNWVVAVSILLCVACIQIGTNFANDYFDFIKGADTEDRLGPTRMTQSGAISQTSMKRGIWLMFSLATISGLYLVYCGGWPIIFIGCLSIVFGLLYTAGPVALAYIGGAELAVFTFFGPVSVIGSYYLLTHSWNFDLAYIGSGIGLISTSLLVVNNTRDIETDRQANKKTCSVRFGPLFSYIEYIFCVYAPIIFLDHITKNSTEQMVCLLFLVVVAMLLTRRFGKFSSDSFNRLLGFNSAYLVLYSMIAIYLFA